MRGHGLEIIGRLAAGAMGEVFLARQRGPGGFARVVAVKRVLVDDDELARRLLDEARVNACITHPNVVGVIGVDQDDDGPFLILEYIDGGTLGMLCRRAMAAHIALPIDACVRIAHDIASGLHAAHERAIVHRDVKPSNILVGVDGRARIGDFGIALDRDAGRLAERLAPRTCTGGIRGTLPYMAPEQLRSEAVTAATDQFSLGVVLWEAISGTHLFPDGDLGARLACTDVPSLRRARRGVAQGLDDVVARMLAHEPGERFASCAEVAAALDAAVPLAGAELSVAAALEEIAGTSIRRRRARLVNEAPTQLDEPPFVTTGVRTREMTASAPGGTLMTALDGRREATSVTATAPTSLSPAAQDVSRATTSASAQRSGRRRAIVSAAAALGLLVAGVLTFVSARAFATDDERTRKFLGERRVAEPLLIQAIVVSEAILRDVAPATFDPVAVRMHEHARRRLELLDAHLRLSDDDRRRHDVNVALDALDRDVVRTLAPLGSDAATGVFQLWDLTRFATIVWMPPAPEPMHANIVDSFLGLYARWPLSDSAEVVEHFARITNTRGSASARAGADVQRLLEQRYAHLRVRWRASDAERARIDADLARIDADAARVLATLAPHLRAPLAVLYRERLRIPPLDQPYPVSPLRMGRPEPLAFTLGGDAATPRG